MSELVLTRTQRAMSHIAYEVEMCALSGMRMVIATDQHARNAYLECTLLHARALEEFLVLAPRSPRPDDMRRTEFAREWNPHPSHAVARLGSRRITVNKNLAHLTWTRVDDPEPPEWPFIEIADDTVAIARAWVPHVTADEGKDLQDPDIKAQLLWNAVRESDRFLPRSARLESTTLVRRHRRRWPWPATQAIHSRVQHAT